MAEKGTNPDAAAWAAALKHRPNYSKSVGEYFATYGVKERGIKKWIEEARTDWIAKGCAAGGPDFPPLDEPPKMLEWWQAHKRFAPSPRLLELAGRPARDLSGSSSKPEASVSPQQIPQPPRSAIDVGSLVGMDLAGAALKQRQLLEAAHQALVAAQGDPNTSDSTITLLAKRWDAAFERLRKVEDSLAAAEKNRGHLIHINDLRSELAPLLGHLSSSFIELLSARLGIPRARARELADEWFRDLRASRFGLVAIVPRSEPRSAA